MRWSLNNVWYIHMHRNCHYYSYNLISTPSYSTSLCIWKQIHWGHKNPKFFLNFNSSQWIHPTIFVWDPHLAFHSNSTSSRPSPMNNGEIISWTRSTIPSRNRKRCSTTYFLFFIFWGNRDIPYLKKHYKYHSVAAVFKIQKRTTVKSNFNRGELNKTKERKFRISKILNPY